MDSQESINSVKMKKIIDHLIIITNYFICVSLIIFRHYYYVKYVFDFFNMIDFFSDFSYIA